MEEVIGHVLLFYESSKNSRMSMMLFVLSNFKEYSNSQSDSWVTPVTQSCSTLQLHGLQHATPPCPSPTPGVHPNSCPSSWWYNPTISSSVVPVSSGPQSCPASGSFQISQFFASGSQIIGVSASVLPMNTQDWSPLGWTGWISLQSKRLSRVFSNTTVQNISPLVLSFLHSPTLTSIHEDWKNYSFD